MKKNLLLFLFLSIVYSNNAMCQIVKTDVWNTPYGEIDSLIVFKEYTIDTIIEKDTIFFVQYWHKEWLLDKNKKMINYCIEKEDINGLEYKGLKNGRWYIASKGSCFSEGTYASTRKLFYYDNVLNTFFSNPKNDKYFFLKDTIEFYSCPNDRYYLNSFYPDTIKVTVTKDSFLIKIGDVPIIKEETKFINEVSADIESGLYNRKYRILLDSLKNVNDN